jgi:hypothetical protein
LDKIKIQKKFEKIDMHVVIIVESMITMFILASNYNWFLCFFTWIPLVNSKPLSKVGPLPPFLSLLLSEVEEKITSVKRNLFLQLGGGGVGWRKGEGGRT